MTEKPLPQNRSVILAKSPQYAALSGRGFVRADEKSKNGLEIVAFCAIIGLDFYENRRAEA